MASIVLTSCRGEIGYFAGRAHPLRRRGRTVLYDALGIPGEQSRPESSPVPITPKPLPLATCVLWHGSCRGCHSALHRSADFLAAEWRGPASDVFLSERPVFLASGSVGFSDFGNCGSGF
jgi:hypothetical protein